MACHVSIGLWVLQKIFAIYGHDIHLGHVSKTIFTINKRSLFPRGLNIKFDLDGPSGFREKMFENNSNTHVYSHWAGAECSLG